MRHYDPSSPHLEAPPPLWAGRVPEERQRGAEAAVAHAEREVDGWGLLAHEALLAFAGSHPDGFLVEEVVAHVGAHGLVPPPPDRRAWGAVVRRAAVAGLIRQTGYRKDSYGSAKAVWRVNG